METMKFFAPGVGPVCLAAREHAASSYGQSVLVIPSGEALGYRDAALLIDDAAGIAGIELYAIEGERYDLAECDRLRAIEPAQPATRELPRESLLDLLSDDGSRPTRGWQIKISTCRCGARHVTPAYEAHRCGSALAPCPACAAEAAANG